MKTISFVSLASSLWLAAVCPAAATEVFDAKIKLFQFQPGDIAIKAGTAVTWVNGDDIEHSVTAGKPGAESGEFDSGFFGKDGAYRFTFAAPGVHEYFCKRHPSMKGIVRVTE